MSVILKIFKTCTRMMFHFQCLKVLTLRTNIQFMTSSLYLENLGLILTFKRAHGHVNIIGTRQKQKGQGHQ